MGLRFQNAIHDFQRLSHCIVQSIYRCYTYVRVKFQGATQQIIFKIPLRWSGAGERFHCIVQAIINCGKNKYNKKPIIKFARTFVLSSRLPYHLNIDYNYPSGNQSNIGNCNIVSAEESINVSMMEGTSLYLFIKSKGKFQALRSLPH